STPPLRRSQATEATSPEWRACPDRLHSPHLDGSHVLPLYRRTPAVRPTRLCAADPQRDFDTPRIAPAMRSVRYRGGDRPADILFRSRFLLRVQRACDPSRFHRPDTMRWTGTKVECEGYNSLS